MTGERDVCLAISHNGGRPSDRSQRCSVDVRSIGRMRYRRTTEILVWMYYFLSICWGTMSFLSGLVAFESCLTCNAIYII